MSKGKKYQEGYVQGYEDAVKTEMVYKEKEKQELLLGLVPVANKGQELIPHKDYEIKQDGDRFYLVKKKKEYPKTYEECCKVLNVAVRDLDILDNMLDTTEIIYNKNLDRLLNSFRKLLICRNAYWKIAGDEMGLGKPWEPDWDNLSINREYIKINKGCFTYSSRVLVFPTAEMRDAFYENFKELIEQCKVLL